MKNFLLALLAALFVVACSSPKSADTATLVLYNGNFFTADTLPQASAVAIRGESILYVGNDVEAKAFADSTTELIDLQGAFAMPGFIEGHGHFLGLGQSLQNLNLMQTTSWEEITRLVAEKAKNTPPGEWIEGRGWHQEKWSTSPGRTVNGYPYHDALSAAAPGHPVVLKHASGHALIANARALELAGISRETSDPLGGRIVRDAAGNLTGVFEENAMDLVTKPLDTWKNKRSEAEKQAAFERTVELAAAACLKKGITSFQDAGSSFWEIGQFERLAASGKLPLRLWVMIGQPDSTEYPRLRDYPRIGLGDGYLTVRAVKAYLDGALGSYGAWLLEPYSDKPGHFGQNTTPVETIQGLAARCRKHGLQLCVHAIGDRANREVLNIYGDVRGLRWRIEHAQIIHPLDIIRFGPQGVIASVQAIHCTSDAPFVVKRLGEERARNCAYPWRSLLNTGSRLANGTDAPVEDVDPLPCIYAAVTRRRPDTGLELFPQQRMSREEALLSYTIWNAYAAFEENEKGSLRPGKRADIVVLSEDLLRCPPEKILTAKVEQVILGGKRVGQK